MKILIVEDHPMMGKTMVDAVREATQANPHAKSPSLVTNHQDALALVGAEHYDVISVDGSFPSHKGPNSGAGLVFLGELEGLGHTGATVFYSDNTSHVMQAASMIVAGQAVVSHRKDLFNAGQGLTFEQWAELCLKFPEKKVE